MKRDHTALLSAYGAIICMLSVTRLILAKKAPDRYDNSPVFYSWLLSLWGALTVSTAPFYPLEWPFMFILVINYGLAAGADINNISFWLTILNKGAGRKALVPSQADIYTRLKRFVLGTIPQIGR